MDKRWIGILIVLIAGLGCMYLIVSNSNSVGSAVSVINDVTITLPPGYITSEDTSHMCVLHNKQTNETIRIRCLDDGADYINEYNNRLKSLNGEDDIDIQKNFTNKTLSMIKYENKSSTDKKDITLVFFEKCKHTFSMQFEHFTNETNQEKMMNFIIDTMKYDFKQNTG